VTARPVAVLVGRRVEVDASVEFAGEGWEAGESVVDGNEIGGCVDETEVLLEVGGATKLTRSRYANDISGLPTLPTPGTLTRPGSALTAGGPPSRARGEMATAEAGRRPNRTTSVRRGRLGNQSQLDCVVLMSRGPAREQSTNGSERTAQHMAVVGLDAPEKPNRKM
jgi:hypothetical protein